MSAASVDRLTIGEVARRAGIRTSTLRFYESVGLLPPAAREGGQRRYDPGVFERLALIQAAQKAGLTIDEIRELHASRTSDQPSPSARWHALAFKKLEEAQALTQRAQEMQRWLEAGLRCDCTTVEECDFVRDVAALHAIELSPEVPRRLSGWRRRKSGPSSVER